MGTKLNLDAVKAAKPRSKPYEVRDAELRGFLLRVQPSGRQTFYVELTRGVRLKLGAYPQVPPSHARTQALAKLGEFAKTGERPVVKSKVTTLRAFLRDDYAPWATVNLKTGARAVETLRAQFGRLLDKSLLDVSAHSVDKWKTERINAGVNPATINRDLVRFKGALTKAVEWDMLPANPIRRVKPVEGVSGGRVRFLDTAEQKRLRAALDARELAHSQKRRSGSQWRLDRGIEPLPPIEGYCDHLQPMVLLALNTGLRKGELTSLDWSDVNLLGKHLTVRASNSKTGEARHMPLNAEAMSVLGKWAKQSGRGRVFPIKDPKKAWLAVLAAAKIANFRFHDLRHSFASHLVMRGVDLNTVRELLGHADLKMSLRYAHLAPEHKAAAVEKLAQPRKS